MTIWTAGAVSLLHLCLHPRNDRLPRLLVFMVSWGVSADGAVSGICNKDATLICLGCDGDAYCRECWNDGHGDGGEKGHRVKKLVWGRKKAVGD